METYSLSNFICAYGTNISGLSLGVDDFGWANKDRCPEITESDLFTNV
ncbi:hypothetical protein DSUL_50067 [Desulfovibrionales bacterium]